MSIKISELTSGAALSGTEELPIVQSGATKKITVQDVADLATSSGATWGSITGTLSSQTDLDTALSGKVDKETGKGLSTNDFTNTLKTKLGGIEAGAEVNVNADWNATSGDAQILNKPTIPSITGLVPYTGANSDVDLGTYSLNTKSVKVNGTAGAGHLGLKHQSSGATATGSESVIYADASGNPKWKNDGNAVQSVMLENSAITGATKTKITYDSKGLVTSGGDLTASDIPTIAQSQVTNLTTDLSGKQATLTDANFGTFSNGLTAKTTPVDADTLNISDSADSNKAKKLSFTNLKAFLKNYFDTIYTTTSAVATQITTALSSLTTADISDSTNKRYVTDAQLTVIGNTSGTNTGDQTLSGLGGVPTTRTINGQALSSDVVVSIFPLFCLKGISNAITGGVARYITFIDASNVNASETSQRMIIPIATTFYNFCILTSTSQPATGSSVFTILKNGVDTGITITIAAGSAAGTFSDTTNSVAFSQFDTVSIKWVNNASTSSCQVTSLSMASK